MLRLIKYALASFAFSVAPLALAGTVKLGDNQVKVLVFGSGAPVYVHVHANEKTSLQAAKQVIKQSGGTIVTISHSGGRLITFSLKGTRYSFDPNRMFSSQGRQKTLAQYSHYSSAAEREVERLAQHVLTLLPKGRIIALHNNSPRYHIGTYQAGGRFAKDAAKIHVNPVHSRRSFFFVTAEKDFNRLKKMNFNVVLQDNRRAVNDGSLSIYAGHSGRAYINVEAAHGDLATQVKMLHALKE